MYHEETGRLHLGHIADLREGGPFVPKYNRYRSRAPDLPLIISTFDSILHAAGGSACIISGPVRGRMSRFSRCGSCQAGNASRRVKQAV
jgi:hypothetical protein